MKKLFVIKNWDTNQYFTCDPNKWWIRDLGQAFFMNSIEYAEIILNRYDYADAFENARFLIIETIFVND